MNAPTFARNPDQKLICPETTGCWRIDTTRGKRYADEVVNFMISSENPTMLAHIVKAMQGRGNLTGVEIGFFHRISERLLETRS